MRQEFFTELLKKFSQEKDKEGRKQDYLARKQGRNEDPRKFYTVNQRLWVQAYAPAKKSLVEFKNAMLMGLYHVELRKTCLLFMPKELQYESQIKAILDYWLVNMRRVNTDPRVPSHDMGGLRNTYSFQTEGKKRCEKQDKLL